MNLEKEVRLTTAWGFDVYTCWNIINSLPCNIDDYVAYDFIMNKVQTALLLIGKEGCYMKSGFKYIVNDQTQIFNQVDKEFAWVLLDCYRSNWREFQLRFRSHSKGLGVVCNR